VEATFSGLNIENERRDLGRSNSQMGKNSIHEIHKSPVPLKISFSQPKNNRNPLAHI
jgi:hypothetical protein